MVHRWTKRRVTPAALAVALALTSPWWALRAHAQSYSDASDAAGAAASRPSPRATEIGAATRSWLALQRSNAAAAPALPTPGAQATLAYERYMDSFRSPIPSSFGSTLSARGGASRADDTSDGSGAAQSPGIR